MGNKQFSERLNQELDKIDVPKPTEERIDAFSKLIKIPRFKAEAILNGQVPFDAALLAKIAQELEVNSDWLVGKE